MLKKVMRFSLLVAAAALLLSACAPAAASTAAKAVDATQAPANTATAAPASNTATVAPAASSGGTQAGGVRYTLVDGKTTASYTVREQLAKHDLPNDAVGSTQKVSGAIVLAADGTVDAQNSKIIVEAGTLQTDQAMRDNFVRRNVLQTDQYKEIVFVPKQVSGLPNPLPGSGALNFKLSGDLTIRSVTKPVTWDVTGTVNGDSATGSAITSFQFADFQLNQPQVPVVLSIVDKITLKIDLTLQRSSN